MEQYLTGALAGSGALLASQTCTAAQAWQAPAAHHQIAWYSTDSFKVSEKPPHHWFPAAGAAATTRKETTVPSLLATFPLQKLVHNAGPRSLEFQRQPLEELAAETQRSLAVRALLSLGGYYSRESRHMRSAKRLYTAVTEQATAPLFLQSACLLRCAGSPYALPRQSCAVNLTMAAKSYFPCTPAR